VLPRAKAEHVSSRSVLRILRDGAAPESSETDSARRRPS
jgi:hypothetical protein